MSENAPRIYFVVCPLGRTISNNMPRQITPVIATIHAPILLSLHLHAVQTSLSPTTSLARSANFTFQRKTSLAVRQTSLAHSANFTHSVNFTRVANFTLHPSQPHIARRHEHHQHHKEHKSHPGKRACEQVCVLCNGREQGRNSRVADRLGNCAAKPHRE